MTQNGLFGHRNFPQNVSQVNEYKKIRIALHQKKSSNKLNTDNSFTFFQPLFEISLKNQWKKLFDQKFNFVWKNV